MSTKRFDQNKHIILQNRQLNHIIGDKDVHLINSLIKKRLITFASEKIMFHNNTCLFIMNNKQRLLFHCILILLCVTCIGTCYAQTNAGSQNVKTNLRKEKSANSILKSLDSLNYKSVPLDEMVDCYYHKPRFKENSLYTITARFRSRLIFQRSPLDKLSKNKVERIMKELQEKYIITPPYGTISETWFSGNLKHLSDPLLSYIGYVSPRESTVVIDKGNIVNVIRTKYLQGRLEDCIIPDKDGYADVHKMDAPWYEQPYYSLVCFANFLNGYESKYSTEAVGYQKFTFLLFTDRTGISTIHLLEPKEPNAIEKELFSNLQKRIAQLEKWSFGFLFTLDGRIMSGKYLEATYSTDKGWSMKDLLLERDTKNPAVFVDGKMTYTGGVKIENLSDLIDMNAIESLSILKGTSATAAYGKYGKNGAIAITLNKDVDPKLIPYNLADTWPKFTGNKGNFLDWLDFNMQNPQYRIKNNEEGIAIVSFVIRKNGKTSDIKIQLSSSPEFSAEAIRLISIMPDWTPGIYKGKTINTSYVLFINFHPKRPHIEAIEAPAGYMDSLIKAGHQIISE